MQGYLAFAGQKDNHDAGQIRRMREEEDRKRRRRTRKRKQRLSELLPWPHRQLMRHVDGAEGEDKSAVEGTGNQCRA